jgi:arsenite-transporting ATPase
MRIIVHTGKGGVGKTSVSAATALHCAEMGLKTIVISTDTAHSLADSLDIKIGPEPVQLYDNLWAQEVDARYTMDKYWWRIQNYLIEVFKQHQAVEEIVAEEVTILPGLEEGAHLLWINQYFEAAAFDVLIVDAAPTAETLRLLSLPDASRWWFQRMMNLMRGAASRFLRPLAKPLLGAELPERAELESVQILFDTLDNVAKLLSDPSISTMRLVLSPEKMVIKETQRTYTYLNLYGYPTDAVICNRIIPDAVTDPYFTAWKALQRQNMQLVEEAFGGLKVLQAPLFDSDVVGMDDLRRLAGHLYQADSPIDIMSAGYGSHSIKQDAATGDYLLRIPLPFAEKADIDLYRSADELTVRVGPYRRNIVLPYKFWKLETGSAAFVDGALQIRFVNRQTDDEQETSITEAP